MPSVWTAELDARLFYILVEKYKVNSKELAEGWKKKYKNDTKPPTASAIDQHIASLRKKSKDGKAPTQTMTTLPATLSGSITATPRKPAASKGLKTPTSGSKRKRGNMSDEDVEMSDGDESEPELSKASFANLGRRTSTPRSQNSARKIYKEDTTDDEDDNETRVEDDAEAAVSVMAGSGTANDDFSDLLNYDGAAENAVSHSTGATPSKKRRVMQDDSDAQSEISNFSAGFR